jgi:hypothetical protein
MPSHYVTSTGQDRRIGRVGAGKDRKFYIRIKRKYKGKVNGG